MEEILASNRKESYTEDIEKAKVLLQEDGRQEEAISLLVAISKKGDKDATGILAQCLINGHGITDDNLQMVEWCVKTSETDKRLKYAMTELFNAIKPEDKDNVSLQDLKEALKTAKKVGKNVFQLSSFQNIFQFLSPPIVFLQMHEKCCHFAQMDW